MLVNPNVEGEAGRIPMVAFSLSTRTARDSNLPPKFFPGLHRHTHAHTYFTLHTDGQRREIHVSVYKHLKPMYL